MHGRLELRVERRAGATRVVESAARAPFHYLPAARGGGDEVCVTVVNSSGGVVGGDRLETDVRLGRDARLVLRTQSATRAYRSIAGRARAELRFGLDRGAFVEYLPDEIIPFAGSDYEQVTDVDLASGAAIIASEVVAAGRLARAERFGFARLAIDFRCSVGGQLRLRDRSVLEPAREPLDREAILGAATAWASFYWLSTEAPSEELVAAIDGALARTDGGLGGATAGPIGVVGRAVAAGVEPLHESIARARDVVRAAVGSSVPASQAILFEEAR